MFFNHRSSQSFGTSPHSRHGRSQAAWLALAATLSFAVTAPAQAESELTLNFHNVAVQAAHGPEDASLGFLGVNHTGILQFSYSELTSSETRFTSIALDGQFQNPGDASFFNQFTATVDGFVRLDQGFVTEGQMTLGVLYTDEHNVQHHDTLSYNITPGAQLSHTQTFFGDWYNLDLTTFGNRFSSDTFATIDISRWHDNQGVNGLFGSLLDIGFSPDAMGYDNDVDILARVNVVPLPPAIAGAGLLLLSLGAGRCWKQYRKR